MSQISLGRTGPRIELGIAHEGKVWDSGHKSKSYAAHGIINIIYVYESVFAKSAYHCYLDNDGSYFTRNSSFLYLFN